MKDDKAYCHRCDTVFDVSVTDEDQKEGIAYGECPGCNKSGKFGLEKEIELTEVDQ